MEPSKKNKMEDDVCVNGHYYCLSGIGAEWDAICVAEDVHLTHYPMPFTTVGMTDLVCFSLHNKNKRDNHV